MIEKPNEECCVEEVSEHKVPEGVIVGEHEVPEDEPDRTGPSKTIQVLRCETFRITVLS